MQIESVIEKLFEKSFEKKPQRVEKLPPSGSYREYYRIFTDKDSVIAVYNTDKKENHAFIGFSNHFHEKGLPVPEIYYDFPDDGIYFQKDLGNITLFEYIVNHRFGDEFPEDVHKMYIKTIAELPKFQVLGSKGLNFSLCYPRADFDRQSMMWDLNYFKYYFLKLAKISFDEQLLENDFHTFCDYLMQAHSDYFLYRDFQSRNVMILDETPYFIDYQGGRKGALQYDIASLLYDAKANIPPQIRNELFEYYLDCLSNYIPVNRKEFTGYFHAYVFVRIMQAMGAYGFRGLYENKTHFLKSIPFALVNLNYLLKNYKLDIHVPELIKALTHVTESKFLQNIGKAETLKVTICSFSFKKGYPVDNSGNGGGFVFDCRSLPNPGRLEEYKPFTGKDKNVIDFIEKYSEVTEFLSSAYALADQSVENYIKRGFKDVMFSFGCTGGQHRSVYCAEQLKKHISAKFDVEIEVKHREQNF